MSKWKTEVDLLIEKASSRSSLTRVEQRRIGQLLQDSLDLNKSQSNLIRLLKGERHATKM